MTKKGTGDRAPVVGTLLERIANQVEEKGDHWVWTGPTNSSGQPIIGWKNITHKVRRVIYAMYFGRTPSDKQIYMACNEVTCVRPQHMTLRDAGNEIDLQDLEMDETIPMRLSPKNAVKRQGK